MDWDHPASQLCPKCGSEQPQSVVRSLGVLWVAAALFTQLDELGHHEHRGSQAGEEQQVWESREWSWAQLGRNPSSAGQESQLRALLSWELGWWTPGNQGQQTRGTSSWDIPFQGGNRNHLGSCPCFWQQPAVGVTRCGRVQLLI